MPRTGLPALPRFWLILLAGCFSALGGTALLAIAARSLPVRSHAVGPAEVFEVTGGAWLPTTLGGTAVAVALAVVLLAREAGRAFRRCGGLDRGFVLFGAGFGLLWFAACGFFLWGVWLQSGTWVVVGPDGVEWGRRGSSRRLLYAEMEAIEFVIDLDPGGVNAGYHARLKSGGWTELTLVGPAERPLFERAAARGVRVPTAR